MNAPSVGQRVQPHLATADSPETRRDVVRVFFRYASPRILTAAALAALAARLVVGDWSFWDLTVVAGILAFWPVLEWLIHVFMLHYRPVQVFGRTFDFPLPQSHRAHHRNPWDLQLVFIPRHVFTYAVPLLLVVWFGAMPTTALALTAITFYLAMALHYEWTHFLVHTRYKPTSRFYRRLWRNHRLHHFKNEHYWFGVTMLGGDRLFGTAPAVDSVPSSPTCRTLGQEATLGV
jgi:hypothetical protein